MLFLLEAMTFFGAAALLESYLFLLVIIVEAGKTPTDAFV
jgi:hypothetical protein